MVRQAHHPELSRRANHNDQNSKFQTFTSSLNNVWVIGDWDLCRVKKYIEHHMKEKGVLN